MTTGAHSLTSFLLSSRSPGDWWVADAVGSCGQALADTDGESHFEAPAPAPAPASTSTPTPTPASLHYPPPSKVFEVIVPEICIAIVSQKWAKRGRYLAHHRHHYRGEYWDGTGRPDNVLLLRTGECGRSSGFLSLSKCCHDPEDCWMDEGYPAVCNEPRWAWGAPCVPEGG